MQVGEHPANEWAERTLVRKKLADGRRWEWADKFSAGPAGVNCIPMALGWMLLDAGLTRKPANDATLADKVRKS